MCSKRISLSQSAVLIALRSRLLSQIGARKIAAAILVSGLSRESMLVLIAEREPAVELASKEPRRDDLKQVASY